MLRIGICDDDSEARFLLKTSLERIAEARSIDILVYEFSSGENTLKWLKTRAGETDVLFLDIEMDGMDGMSTARKIRETDNSLVIIFVTGYSDYVFDGYSVNALDYIMKPADENRLNSVITRALGAMHINTDDVFVCKNSDGIYRIPKSSILYFSSDRRTVTCFSNEREYTFYDRLDNIEDSVGPSFIRIHQRYLVNSKYIKRITSGQAELESITLPISRACQQKAAAAFARAIMED